MGNRHGNKPAKVASWTSNYKQIPCQRSHGRAGVELSLHMHCKARSTSAAPQHQVQGGRIDRQYAFCVHVCVYVHISIYKYMCIHTYTHGSTYENYLHTSHYITMQHITLHYITLHYITLHYITLHYSTLHDITLHHIILHYTTLHYITLRYARLHYVTFRYISLHYIISGILTSHCTALLHYIVYTQTQRLKWSSFLVMTYFLLGDYNILPKKELHWSLWVYTHILLSDFQGHE